MSNPKRRIEEIDRKLEELPKGTLTYKTINGKLYKRLYDTTHEKWLTDWIPC